MAVEGERASREDGAKERRRQTVPTSHVRMKPELA
jgi:hypothetical protein